MHSKCNVSAIYFSKLHHCPSDELITNLAMTGLVRFVTAPTFPCQTWVNAYMKTNKAVIISFYSYHNCVNNKMLELDWFLTALIYGLIGCLNEWMNEFCIYIAHFRFKLSNLTCPIITNICDWTGKIEKLNRQ